MAQPRLTIGFAFGYTQHPDAHAWFTWKSARMPLTFRWCNGELKWSRDDETPASGYSYSGQGDVDELRGLIEGITLRSDTGIGLLQSLVKSYLHPVHCPIVPDAAGWIYTAGMYHLHKQALTVQDACNLSGVVTSLRECLYTLNRLRVDTAGIRRHPVSVLFASKIADLCYLPQSSDYFCEAERTASQIVADYEKSFSDIAERGCVGCTSHCPYAICVPEAES